MSTPVLLALGGNVGDVRHTGQSALAELSRIQGIEIQATSSWYSTEPIGCEGEFLNAAALLHCDLTAMELLQNLLAIETRHGRVRSTHWGPRPLDLDLILFGTQQIDMPHLITPHPAMWIRRFVLDPACEVAGAMLHPQTGQTLNQLREQLRLRPLPIHWSGSIPWGQAAEHPLLHRFRDRIMDVEAKSAVVRMTHRFQTVPRVGDIPLPVTSERAIAQAALALASMLDEPVRIPGGF